MGYQENYIKSHWFSRSREDTWERKGPVIFFCNNVACSGGSNSSVHIFCNIWERNGPVIFFVTLLHAVGAVIPQFFSENAHFFCDSNELGCCEKRTARCAALDLFSLLNRCTADVSNTSPQKLVYSLLTPFFKPNARRDAIHLSSKLADRVGFNKGILYIIVHN